MVRMYVWLNIRGIGGKHETLLVETGLVRLLNDDVSCIFLAMDYFIVVGLFL